MTDTRVQPQVSSALERVGAPSLPVAPSASAPVRMASGHGVLVDSAASRLRITNAAGRVELTVRCTERGCVLEFAESELQLQAAGKLALQCDELKLQARTRIELETTGDLHTRVGGERQTLVAGRAFTEADELELRAASGDAVLHANDRVRVVAEKILLNSEHERATTRDEFEALWKRLGL